MSVLISYSWELLKVVNFEKWWHYKEKIKYKTAEMFFVPAVHIFKSVFVSFAGN